MFFIDLVGCAVAPIVFWLAMSSYGISSVILGSTVAYAVLAVVFVLWRRRA